MDRGIALGDVFRRKPINLEVISISRDEVVVKDENGFTNSWYLEDFIEKHNFVPNRNVKREK